MEVTLQDIEAAESRERAARQTLTSAIRETEDLKVRFTCQKYNIKIGDVVRGTNGVVGRIVSIKSYGPHVPPTLTVAARKKDGTFGNRHQALYCSWERIEG